MDNQLESIQTKENLSNSKGEYKSLYQCKGTGASGSFKIATGVKAEKPKAPAEKGKKVLK